jgi:hypothetical protein
MQQGGDRESHAMLKGFMDDWRTTGRVPQGAIAHFKFLNPRLFVGQFLPLLLSLECIPGIDQLPPPRAGVRGKLPEQQGTRVRMCNYIYVAADTCCQYSSLH